MFILATVYYVYLQLQDGKNALMLACINGFVDCVEALLQRGADPNIQDDVSNTKAVRCVCC